jgi:ParB family chromosome partitioning protein
MVTKKSKGLGRGLEALLGPTARQDGSAADTPASNAGQPMSLMLADMVPGMYQPRTRMDEGALYELAESIKAQGIMQPILVRKLHEGANSGKFEIIAGERRFRAAKLAGLDSVPVLVRDVPDEAAAAMALIENIQREDLNPIEEAEAYKRLIDEHGLTQEELAGRVHKERSTVANALRLLRLPDSIKQAIVAGQLSMGHARALLAIADEGDLRKAADKVIAEELSVRAAEALVQRLKSKRQPKEKQEKESVQVRHLVEKLQRKLGAKVELKDKGGSGTLEIRYGSLTELDRILAGILGSE